MPSLSLHLTGFQQVMSVSLLSPSQPVTPQKTSSNHVHYNCVLYISFCIIIYPICHVYVNIGSLLLYYAEIVHKRTLHFLLQTHGISIDFSIALCLYTFTLWYN